MKNSLETRIGMFFALALVVAVIVIELTGGTSLFKRGHGINALFENIQDLKEGDPVKMAGVRIGTVNDTSTLETIGVEPVAVHSLVHAFNGEDDA